MCWCDQMCDKLSHNNVAAPSLKTSVWFHPPSWVLYPCKSNRSPMYLKSTCLVCNMLCCCQNKLNSFCYICGEVVLKITPPPKKKTHTHSQNSWEKLMKCILTVRSEIKIKFGRGGFAAAHVQGLWQVLDN